MVGENFEIYMSQMAKIRLKLSTMVGENIEICWHQMARNAFNCPPWLEKILKYARIKWLEMHLFVQHGWRKF